MDNLENTQRSKNMFNIKSKNTKPEMVVRSQLFKKGYRFKIHDKKQTNFLKLSRYFIIILSIIAFIIASKGFSVLYLFLLADLFCCAFVLTVFYSFYNKQLNEKTAYISIFIGLIGGFLLFPAPDFSKSLLIGIVLSVDLFPSFVSQSLLFLSFLVATVTPAIVIMIYDSFKR